jgi:hypothetical protein
LNASSKSSLGERSLNGVPQISGLSSKKRFLKTVNGISTSLFSNPHTKSSSTPLLLIFIIHLFQSTSLI